MEHGFANVNGVNLHYVTAGEGPLVILLHGFPEFWYSWRKVIPPLAKHFRVVAPDMRGYNESDKPKGVAAYTLDKLAGDVVGLIDHFGYEKAHIVGHDWGGAPAWAMPILHPDRLEKLVILNSPHPALFRWQLKNNSRQRRRSWYMGAFQIPVIPDFFIKLFVRKFIKSSLRGWAINKNAFSDEDLEAYIMAFSKPGAVTATVNYYRANGLMPKEIAKKFGGEIHSPVMVLWGQDDIALGAELTDGLERYLKGEYVLHKIENCSHWVQAEKPLFVAEKILEFLESS